MIKVLIARDKSDGKGDDSGRPGKLTVPGLFECATLELGYRDLDGNGKRDPKRSCIAAGTYRCSWSKSPTRTNPNGSPEYTYLLEKVTDAEGIRIHHGNFAGDVTKGYVSDVEGCILLGRAYYELEIPQHKREKYNVRRMNQNGVSSSRDTIMAFHELMGKVPFELTITESV